MLESAWRVHVAPRWGKVAVADIDRLGVEAWIASMGAKGAGATTVLRAHGVLSGILADAIKAKRLSANPTKGVENLPRKTGKRRVYLSADDVHRLADESAQHRTLVLVLAYTGIRWGEAIGLRVRDIEFLRRRLSVSENAVQPGVGHAVGPSKGRKARSVRWPSSSSTSSRCSARTKRVTSWFSPAVTAAAFRGRSHRPDGSRPQSRKPRCRRLRPTTYGTLAHHWRSRPGSMCLRCNACSDTCQQR